MTTSFEALLHSVVCSAALLPCASAAPPASSPPAPPALPPPAKPSVAHTLPSRALPVLPPSSSISPRELAEKVSTALRELPFAHVRAVVRKLDDQREMHRLLVTADMAPARLHCTLRDASGALLAAYALDQHRMQEFVPSAALPGEGSRTISNSLIEFDAPQPDGTDDSILFSRADCLHGVWMQTWLGPTSSRADFFSRALAGAGRIEPRDDPREPFHVIRSTSHDQPDGSTFTVTQDITVDALNFLPTRWSTIQQTRRQGAPALTIECERTITFTLPSTNAPARTDWKLDAAALARDAATAHVLAATPHAAPASPAAPAVPHAR